MNPKDLEYFIKQVDKYLDGQLDSMSLAELEIEINSKPEIKEALKIHIDARANIRIAGEKKQKAIFNSKLEDHNFPKTKAAKSYNFKKIGIVIITLVLLTAIFFFIKTQRQLTTIHQSPIAYLEDLSPQLLRSEKGDTKNENWTKAIDAYVAKDFKLAIEYFNQLDASPAFLEQHSGKLNLFNGIAHTKVGSYTRATDLLSKIPDSNPYYDQAQWYEAMTYLMADQKQEAKILLEEISKLENHFRQKEASLFLKELK